MERHSDSLENEIQSQTPLPLYLGLMGTVAGIILGLTTISDFSQIENVVTILMSDVAVAMIASFTGILFTTLSLWRSKQCKVIVEERKTLFIHLSKLVCSHRYPKAQSAQLQRLSAI